MPRFFVNKDRICDGYVTLEGTDAHHVARSLRMAAGEHITVCDPDGVEYDCELTDFEGDSAVRAKILSFERSLAEPPFRVTLYQALPKGDKLDSIIQKAVECGACRVVPFESAHCVVRVKAEAEEKKTERRARIALEAAKQCGRGMIPSVGRTVSFEEMLREAADADLALFCYEDERGQTLRDVLDRFADTRATGMPSVSVVVGSEGGFSHEEALAARAAGLLLVGLGKRILRTETAGAFVLSALVFRLEL